MRNFFTVVLKKIDGMSDGFYDCRVVRKKKDCMIDGVADGRVFGKKSSISDGRVAQKH